jgi:RNA polymerase sigma-70 factor, ECF subfamily
VSLDDSTLADADVLAAVRDGDRASFDVIVARYRPRLTRFARQALGDAGAADDLVQETFVAVYAARDTFDRSFAFSTWVWTILLNLCRRERRRRTSLERTWAGAADSLRSRENTESSGERLEREEQAAQLRQLLDELPIPQADALRLRFFAELPFDEIASAMGSSVSGAKVRVRKGLETLAARLGRGATAEETNRAMVDGEGNSR